VYVTVFVPRTVPEHCLTLHGQIFEATRRLEKEGPATGTTIPKFSRSHGMVGFDNSLRNHSDRWQHDFRVQAAQHGYSYRMNKFL